MQTTPATSPSRGPMPPAADCLYIDLILDIMVKERIKLRDLSARAGISKTRLGVLLHRDPAKRSAIGLVELQMILDALGTC